MAVKEFDEAVSQLRWDHNAYLRNNFFGIGVLALFRNAGIIVHVFQDTDNPAKPDAIFPNNWFSTHKSVKIYSAKSK